MESLGAGARENPGSAPCRTDVAYQGVPAESVEPQTCRVSMCGPAYARGGQVGAAGWVVSAGARAKLAKWPAKTPAWC